MQPNLASPPSMLPSSAIPPSMQPSLVPSPSMQPNSVSFQVAQIAQLSSPLEVPLGIRSCSRTANCSFTRNCAQCVFRKWFWSHITSR
ncbi:hypothetical protein MRB53_011085 [Persea americana]|uniref:Uncharacterized protein n=1 Tax=Persea americana TaxID=3435 RepID=A0ACC2LTZ6_PERAE|nr:hypothetical protein MRB53_011085 [Persea americana]